MTGNRTQGTCLEGMGFTTKLSQLQIYLKQIYL